MGYYTRVLSKLETVPTFSELADLVRGKHPHCKLTLESGTDRAWESLLLTGDGDVEIAIVECNPVAEGTLGHDELNEFIDEVALCKPESSAEWLLAYLKSVKTIFAFQHLRGSDSEEGFDALHLVRTSLWQRGERHHSSRFGGIHK